MAVIQPVNNTHGNGMKSHFMFCQFLESHVYLLNLGSLGWGYNTPSPKHCHISWSLFKFPPFTTFGFTIGQTATTGGSVTLVKHLSKYRPSTKEDESSRGIILVVYEEQHWPNLEKGSGHDNQIGHNAITK
ncbi:hypothetical protein C8R44DRAFT_745533 [Mycena epipterygia]|nr:hypothetical protein C8R44DRAFT_745533 [Mycena epipterygia]